LRRVIPLGVLLAAVTLAPAPLAAQSPEPTQKAVVLSDAEQERFLLEGQIVRRRSAPGGVTLSVRATLRLGDLEHECHIQKIDQHRPSFAVGGVMEMDFHDSFRGNVAGYRLDRLLGLGMVPVSVARKDGDTQAAFTWWVDDGLMDERQRIQKKVKTPDVEGWNRQMYVLRIFDQFIYNFDRNLGNLIIDKDWRIWMIDHTRAFKMFKKLRDPIQLGTRCERDLLEALRKLDPAAVRAAMKDVLTPAQTDGLLARRDLIVKYFDARIAEIGEEKVLYDLPPRIAVPANAH